LAEAEFDEAVDYYLLCAGPAVSRNFTRAIHSALALLVEHPAIGAPTRNQARRTLLHGFPFDLIYRLQADKIVIIALANQSRRPGYWAGRR
jgi:toxin ParE1/3/4